MQTLPAAAVFGLLPVPAMPDSGSGSLVAQPTATKDTDVSRPSRGQPWRSTRLSDHVKAWLEGLGAEQSVHRPHPL
jgi:hypothetical protein